MEFHGIDSQGEITVQRLTGVPVWDASSVGRIIYNQTDSILYICGMVRVGAVAPANTIAGLFWEDITAHILKLRNEADDAWLEIWDLVNDKPANDIQTSWLGNGVVTAIKLGTGSVTTPKVADGNITPIKLSTAIRYQGLPEGYCWLNSYDGEVTFPILEDVAGFEMFRYTALYSHHRWRVWFRMVNRVPALRVMYEYHAGTVRCDSGYVNGVATTTSSSNNAWRPSCTWSTGGTRAWIGNEKVYMEGRTYGTGTWVSKLSANIYKRTLTSLAETYSCTCDTSCYDYSGK